MKRSEPVELMNMCVLRRGSKVLVQDRTDPTSQALLFRAVMLKRVNPLQMPSFVRFRRRQVWQSPLRACAGSRTGAKTVCVMSCCSIARSSLPERCALPTGARSGGRSSPVSPRSILHLPTCSTFSACLKKMISTSCSTARTVKIGLTN